MFKGAETEWLPTLGESWHVPQVPVCKEDSRRSHITVLKNRKFVDGKGRRYIDKIDGSSQPYGLATAHDVELGCFRHRERDTDQAFLYQKAVGLTARLHGGCVYVVITI